MQAVAYVQKGICSFARSRDNTQLHLQY